MVWQRSARGPRKSARGPSRIRRGSRVALVLLVSSFGLACLLAMPACRAVRFGNARGWVAELHECPEARVRHLGSGRFRADGCGRRHVYYCASHLVECADLHRLVRRRSAALLQCQTEAVQVAELEPAIFLSRGCGRQIVQRCGLSREGDARCRVQLPPR